MYKNLHSVNEVAMKLLEPLTLEQTYKLIVDELIRETGTNDGSIVLEVDHELRRVYTTVPKFYGIALRKDGYTYKSFKNNKPYIVSTEKIKQIYPNIAELGYKTSIMIPLSYKNKSIGVVILQSKKKMEIKKNNLNYLTLIGSMASLAIRKAQLYEEKEYAFQMRDEVKESEEVTDKIYKSGLKFLLPLRPEETYATIVKEALRLMGGEYGSIFIEKNEVLERVYASHPFFYKVVPRKRGFMYSIYKSKKPKILDISEVDTAHPELREMKVKTDIMLPLYYQNKSLGILTILSTQKNAFTQKHMRILKLFSPLATLAIKKTQLYDETKRSLEMRDLFISIAAHELRTPLTTLTGYVQLLNAKYKDRKIPEADWVKQISFESKRLTKLIQELLEINQIQTGKFHYSWEECDLVETIKLSIASVKIVYPEHKFIFENHKHFDDAMIIGDHAKLMQVFINLLTNAAKFSPKKSKISVSLALEHSRYIVSVKDEGEGISEEDKKKIFNIFYKGNTNTKEGMGLGLFLTKNIVEQHHGVIDVESKKNKGTTMIINLPKAVV